MGFDMNDLEATLFDLIDQVKVIISQDVWENILLNCTKNEVFVLMLLYRQSDVNMTQIADYLNAPLNTTTGIVSRMEKKEMVKRIRSEQDKRVVTIELTAFGRKQMSDIMGMFLHYGQMVMTSLKAEEITLMSGVMSKIVALLQNTPVSQVETEKKIRKIAID